MPRVFIFSFYERLGHFFNLLNVYKRKYGARKLFQNNQRNKKISKCLIIKLNISGFLLLTLPQNFFFKNLRFLSFHVFSLEKLSCGKHLWEVIRGPVQTTGAAGQLVAIERQ